MYLLKLMKLLYLAERESLHRYGWMMANDNAVSMDHGPLLSQAYNLAGGAMPSIPNGWDTWISAREGHKLALAQDIATFNLANLDKLSRADIEILDSVWNQFGTMNRWDICDWMHVNCAEWKDPKGSSLPIYVSDILIAVGYTLEQSMTITNAIDDQKQIGAFLTSH